MMNSIYVCVFILSSLYASEQSLVPTIEEFEQLKAQVEKNTREIFDVKREFQEMKNGSVLTSENIDINKLDDSMQKLQKLVSDVIRVRDVMNMVPFNQLRERDFWPIEEGHNITDWELKDCVETLHKHVENYKKLLKNYKKL